MIQQVAMSLIADKMQDMIKKELADPNSEWSKALTDKMKGLAPEQIKDILDGKPDTKGTGTSGWENMGPSGAEKAVLDVILPAAGDVAAGVGSGMNLYAQLFSNALQSMAQQKAKDMPGVGSALTAMAAGRSAKGGLWDIVGNTLANRIYTISDTIKNDNDRSRMMAMQMNEQPNVGFNQYMSKTAPSGTRGSRGTPPKVNP